MITQSVPLMIIALLMSYHNGEYVPYIIMHSHCKYVCVFVLAYVSALVHTCVYHSIFISMYVQCTCIHAYVRTCIRIGI